MESRPATVGLRRTAGGLLVVGAAGFAAAATVLSSTFGWPDILREPGSVVLPAFAAGGDALVWTWFATAWTYAILAVPMLVVGWSVTLSVIILRFGVLPRWLGAAGVVRTAPPSPDTIPGPGTPGTTPPAVAGLRS